MTAYHYLYLVAIGLVWIGWETRGCAEADVTIYNASSSSASSTASSPALAADGTPIVHKSSHRKKKKTSVTAGTTTATTSTASTDQPASAPAPVAKPKKTKTKKVAKTVKTEDVTPLVISAPVVPKSSDAAHADANFSVTLPPAVTPPITIKKSPASTSQLTISAPARTTSATGPEVETGLPVARPGSTSLTRGTSSYQIASAFPIPNIPAGSALGSYSSSHVKKSSGSFNFTNFDRRVRNVYPWKINIITTEFWIGEGGSSISPTDNIASAWDANWRTHNHGTDTPDDRSGYAPATHFATINPFYVALPFNDLAFPDKARRWLPAGWYRPPKDGKPVSACKDRWVEIKNDQGDVCYAQWEDVGPLRYDHAEYVFGPERPDTYTRAGLDVSPAVAQYLNINGKNRLTRWRFVDDSDVVPGAWLKYEEEAVLFNAMHNLKSDPTRLRPIQDAQRPVDDSSDIDSNTKKVGAAKG